MKNNAAARADLRRAIALAPNAGMKRILTSALHNLK
jgi:hypothetical protein